MVSFQRVACSLWQCYTSAEVLGVVWITGRQDYCTYRASCVMWGRTTQGKFIYVGPQVVKQIITALKNKELTPRSWSN